MTRPRFCGVSSSRAKSGQNYLSIVFIIIGIRTIRTADQGLNVHGESID